VDGVGKQDEGTCMFEFEEEDYCDKVYVGP
jgi:hypothetical protein